MKEMIKIILTVAVALVIIAGSASALEYYKGTPDEINQLKFDSQTIDDKLSELGFSYTPAGSDDTFGGVTNYDSLTLDSNLIVGGTITITGALTVTGTSSLADNSINYNEIDSDAGKIGWITCDELATETTNTNPCSYTHSGDDIFVVAMGAIVTSGSASDVALLDVGQGSTATDTYSSANSNIFADLDVSCAGGAACNWAPVDTTNNNATSSASAFQAFVLPAESSIVATQYDPTAGDMGDIEEAVVTFYYRYFQLP